MSNFWHGFNFGFTFGLLRSNPIFGCFNSFMPSFNFFPYPFIPSVNSVFHFDFSRRTSTPTGYATGTDIHKLNFSDIDFSNLWKNTDTITTPKFNFEDLSNKANFDLSNIKNTQTTTDSSVDTSTESAKSSEKTDTEKEKTPKPTNRRNIPDHWSKMTDEQMKQVYGDYSTDITELYTGTAEKLDKFLDSTGSKLLKNKGSVFMEAQRKYGISALVLIAICGIESTYGTKGKNNAYYNVANRRSGRNSFKHYNNVDEAIMDLARDLRQNYVDNPPEKKGAHLTKIYQVNARYCPVQADNNTGIWASGVTRCLNNIKRVVA
ncbi:glucosaminidase domain-containing protein [bacterium]|nr:glucosaminidase domain-containing protein [bacterium]